MAGTQIGGQKAAAVNKSYNEDFYKIIGRKGGKVSRGGGFAKNRELASTAGRLGGQTSRRGKTQQPGEPTPEQNAWTKRIFGEGA